MRIVIVTNHFWPEEFRINDVARGLVARGHRVSVLTGIPNYPGGKFFSGYGIFKKRRETHQGIEIRRSPLIPRGSGSGWRLILNYLSHLLFSCLLAPWCFRGEYDVIFVFETSPVTVGFPALVLRAMKRLPIVFWVQDLWPDTLSATGVIRSQKVLRGIGAMVRFIYGHCDRVLVQSRAFSKSVEALFPKPERIVYLPNSAEEFYRPFPPEEAVAEGALMAAGFRVVFAGNIGVAQDFGTILDAAEALKHVSDIQWIIIGDGRRRAWVEEQRSKRGLEQTFHLLGRHPAEAMPRFFALADALLVTLKKEPIFAFTIPSKIQSYLACGRPIVAALEGEGKRVIEQAGAGFTSPPEEPQALAAAVLKMYRLPAREREAMGRAGRTYFEREFEPDLLLDRLEGVLKEVSGEGRR
ncbi:MAG: glycosyltransferase family 4 protein [Deltaproteobacteria bacterium]|nr:glycosyltransferase family 4 protein [Deltaproteobacteria bacterium]